MTADMENEEIDWLVTLAYPGDYSRGFAASVTGRDFDEAYDNAAATFANFVVTSVVPYY